MYPIISQDLCHLETKRLLLRPFTEEDEPLALAIASDRATTRYLYYWGRTGVTPAADARRFLQYAVSNWRKNPVRAREYCLILKESGQPMGDGSLEWVEGQKGVAEIGWILLPAFRKRGYALEMAEALLQAGFEVLKAEAVIAHCDSRNAPSYHLMERLGMRLLGVEKGARPAKAEDQANGDECTYQITRQEWEQRPLGTDNKKKGGSVMEIIHTSKAPQAIGPYSQAISASGFIFTSGQIALNPETGALRGGTIEEQTEQAIQNLEEVLLAAGSSLGSVIKTTCFLQSMGDFSAFNAVYEKRFPGKPARSCVEVAALPKGALVEIEAVALPEA